ncbi:tail fiber domain-containing protein [Streptomyces sp. CB03911]|uniref:tail fiber domain-containing protein n=1 Tax=Streptomycetaceae TaxID=2062 RepID=UPI000B2A6F8B|nr:tail fiber domain-containing protein [Streptomyces sp. CB03911]
MRIFHRRSRPAGPVPADSRAGGRQNGSVAQVGAVNGYTVLETVAALPISTWRYLWEPEDVRHLGPMAQDWHAAFRFNQDDTVIPVVDGLGVALVCVQALHRRVEELTAEVGRLRDGAGANGPVAAAAAAPIVIQEAGHHDRAGHRDGTVRGNGSALAGVQGRDLAATGDGLSHHPVPG